MKIAWSVRLARDADVPGLEKLIPLSVRALQARYYSTAQMDGTLGSVFRDRTLRCSARKWLGTASRANDQELRP